METYQKPFLHKKDAKITNIEEKDGFVLVELDDTIFYPSGGGQPHDKGTIKNNSFNGEVVDVFKKNNKIIHKVRVVSGTLKKGDAIACEHDIKRRLSLVRMHSGEHIFVGALLKIIKDAKVDKIMLDEHESSLFVKCKDLTWEKLFEAEKIANQVIKQGRDIVVKEVSKEEAKGIKGLRIKLDRIKSNKIRLVEIKGHDIAACTGTHAFKTDFIGNILITKFNIVKGAYEIRFKTDVSDDLFELARIARLSSSIIKKDVKQVPDFIKNLMADNELKTNRIRELSSKLVQDVNKEKISNISFISNIFEDIERKQLVDHAASLLKEKTIVCFLNKLGDNAQVIIVASEDSGFKANELLKNIMEKFNGKGGGRDSFAMGSFKKEFADKALDFVRNIIKSSLN